MATKEEVLEKEWNNFRRNGKSFKSIALEAMDEWAEIKLSEYKQQSKICQHDPEHIVYENSKKGCLKCNRWL